MEDSKLRHLYGNKCSMAYSTNTTIVKNILMSYGSFTENLIIQVFISLSLRQVFGLRDSTMHFSLPVLFDTTVDWYQSQQFSNQVAACIFSFVHQFK